MLTKKPTPNGNKPDRLSRRSVLKGIGAAGVATLAAESGASLTTALANPSFKGKIGVTEADSRPYFQAPDKAPGGAANVVLILVDDVGFSDFGCYGGDIRTPAVDRIAGKGLRYTNFRTTGVCSATRAALLTGLNPHSAGIGRLTDTDRGYPGYRGDLTKDAATIAELLRARGYSTYHSGKWHLNYSGSSTAIGPMDNWPAQRGFDRAYWFHGHSSDYFRPAEMFDGNSPIEVLSSDDYYATDDFTDRAIDYLRTHNAVAPEKPFFLYLAFNAAHSPLQSRAEDRDTYQGQFDHGWDRVRDERLARQKAMGLVPADTELTPRNPDVAPWASLRTGQRRLYARYMEVYAGVVQRVDWNIGRVVEILESLDQLDNTLLIIASDNGGSAEGGVTGTPNMLAGLRGSIPVEEAMKYYETMGERDTFPHYPIGWAQASNTPFKMYKQFAYLGGVSDPLVLHWPNGIKSKGGIRSQYAHVIDLYPTIADALNIGPLETFEGRELKSIEGRSLRPTFDSASAQGPRSEQHFELNGRRAMYADGWHIVTTHRDGRPYSEDVWELYQASEDFNETNDLAAVEPQKVRELEKKWFNAARRYSVLPLYDKPVFVSALNERWKRIPPGHVEFVPPVRRIMAESAPAVLGRDHTITVQLERGPRDDGVLVAYGTMFTGFVLYVKNGRLVYESSAIPFGSLTRSSIRLPEGECTVRYVQTMTRKPYEGSGVMYLNDHEVGRSDATPFGVTYQGLEIGRNGACPVSRCYEAPFPFSGKIRQVMIDYDTSEWTSDDLRAMLERRTIRI